MDQAFSKGIEIPVLALGRRADALRPFLATCPNIDFVHGDLSDLPSLNALASDLTLQHPDLARLINNAGMPHFEVLNIVSTIDGGTRPAKPVVGRQAPERLFREASASRRPSIQTEINRNRTETTHAPPLGTMTVMFNNKFLKGLPS